MVYINFTSGNFYCYIVKMHCTRKISAEVRAYARFLRSERQLKYREIAEKCGISVRSAKRILATDLSASRHQSSAKKAGRPRKINQRTERKIIRAIPKLRLKEGTFSVKRLLHFAGVTHLNVSVRTVQRMLNRNGFFFLQARKKGLMSSKDLRERVKFARKIKTQYNASIWKKGIAFYLDGTSFVHKMNPLDQARAPKTRIWRKKSEGLQRGCLAKGQKVGNGGRTVKMIVAISHKSGVVCCKPYKEMNGAFFAKFINDHFEDIYRKAQKPNTHLFVQDGDPSQNSGKAREALRSVNAQLLKIPPRSPDINPIENIFKYVGEKLRRDALEKEISRENFQQFERRIIQTITSIPCDYIDRVIESMSKRMNDIIRRKGQRLKY